MMEQPLSAKNVRPVTPNSSNDAAIGHSRDISGKSGYFSTGGDHSAYPPNVYAPQAHAIYFKGYENAPGDCDEFPPSHANVEGLNIGSPGIYNENSSLVFHTGYGYSQQMPYGPYTPVTMPLPSVRGDAHLYSLQYPLSGPPYYQQIVPRGMSYITSLSSVSQPELNSLVSIDQQIDGMVYGQKPAYPSPLGSFGRGNISENHGNLGFQDLHQGFDLFRSGSLSSDRQKPSDRHRALASLSTFVSPQTIGNHGSFGQNVAMASQQPRSFCGFGSGTNSYNRDYLHGSFNQGSSFGSASISSVGSSNGGWLALDGGRGCVTGSGSLCSCSGTLDIFSEQNRGPRASKLKSQIRNENSPSDSSKDSLSTAKPPDKSYNRPDFVTEYKDAKFFVIKSYSEDNVHKSIKYGVWASTPNGNRKLDAAYREAKEKQNTCHIFLLFSVNASAQFCGIAEMVGPVDFDKSVGYWQQDKWSGQFPVKWHIIKDAPNSQFRHIVLESNDNKPVTNSRDTQEVKLEQGIEMLNIFKNYRTNMSILNDFDYYEDRQRAMQERKARQQANLVGSEVVVGGSENRSAVTLSNDFIKHMSKSFAQVVRLEESGIEDLATDRGATSALDGPIGTRVILEDTATMSSGQTI